MMQALALMSLPAQVEWVFDVAVGSLMIKVMIVLEAVTCNILKVFKIQCSLNMESEFHWNFRPSQF